MNEKEYRENEAKNLEKLAEAMGHTAFVDDGVCLSTIVGGDHYYIGEKPHGDYWISFDPEHNAEQRQELLEWYFNTLDDAIDDAESGSKECTDACRRRGVADYIFNGDNPPLALILAAIELIEVK